MYLPVRRNGCKLRITPNTSVEQIRFNFPSLGLHNSKNRLRAIMNSCCRGPEKFPYTASVMTVGFCSVSEYKCILGSKTKLASFFLLFFFAFCFPLFFWVVVENGFFVRYASIKRLSFFYNGFRRCLG